MKAILTTLLAAAGLASGGRADDYAKRLEFSVVGYSGETALANFPLPVKLSESIEGFRYSDFLSDGADLRFTLADGTALAHELECWNPSGTSVAWVRIPSLVNGLKITMSYGYAGAVAETGTVFKDAGYTFVHHFAETSGDYSDATGNGHTGARTTYGDETVVAAAGLLGNAAKFGQGAQNAKGPSVRIATWPQAGISDTFTYSTWIRYTKVGQSVADDCLVGSGTFRMELYYGAPKHLKILDPGCNWISKGIADVFPSAVNNGNWYNLAVTFAGTVARVYVNGVLKKTVTLVSPQEASAKALGIGNSDDDSRPGFKGLIDETRVHPQALSADWLAAEYAAASDTNGSFLSLYKRTLYVVPPSSEGHVASAPYASWETAATNIQDAVDANAGCSDVKIAPGTYPISAQLCLTNAGATYACVDRATGLPVVAGALIDASGADWTTSAVLLSKASMRGFRIVGATNATQNAVGGGLVVAADTDAGRVVADTTIEACVLTGARATGGGIYLNAGYRGTLTNCVVRGCAAYRGGGLYCANDASDSLTSHATVRDCRFEGNLMNVSWGLGGAAYANGLRFERCVFAGNACKSDCLSYSACVHSTSRLQMIDCRFEGNKTASNGTSGVTASGDSVVRGCVFAGNGAKTCDGLTRIESCVFTNNVGPVVNSRTDLRNCLLVGNRGVAVKYDGTGTNRIENCTIVGNSSYGVQSSGSGASRTVVVNSIISGNATYDCVTWTADFDFVVSNSVVKSIYTATTHDETLDSCRYEWGIDALKFVNSSSGDYRLTRKSPCIEAGVALDWMTASATDLAGNPRVLDRDGRVADDALPDIGCYECDEKHQGLLLIVW